MPALLLGPLLRYVGTDSATVWVEVDRACRVSVLGVQEPTFEVSGHHYALVGIDGLGPGSVTEYSVELDGELAWPEPGTATPPSRIRTLRPGHPQRIGFGSCRAASSGSAAEIRQLGVDALEAYAIRMAADPDVHWLDLFIMLGDQVYADETSSLTQARIGSRRSLDQAPGPEVADFEEYTWLYQEAWSDPRLRWLMSTVPIAMIFDDHDVRDDWNTSRSWRDELQATPWWEERIVGALTSYWVYQHLGNLSPGELAVDDAYRKVRAAADSGDDAAAILRALALAADREADGAKGYRWSFGRDLGRTRLIVIDSRCGRILDGDQRSMLSEAEFDWIEKQVDGDYDHLLVATSVPWLMAHGLHAIETWDEQLAADPRPRRAALGEKVRRGVDLEHWPAFAASFQRLARLLADLGSGRRSTGEAPATICVLSGDVHHSYVCAADLSELAVPDPVTAQIYQLTCSPMRNSVPALMRAMLRTIWFPPVAQLVRLLLTRGGQLRKPGLTWRTTAGPFFGNAISTLTLDGRSARLVMESSRSSTPQQPLDLVVAQDLSE